ncbi:ThuA domain-containing protein [Myceligenerans crystallogenes]|uniref:ThuA-like domain-containing protein n=1 Tax=Myceligenerans crystallogenes TaxID=316335 RepID=A0ABP4ZAS3_9MICO
MTTRIVVLAGRGRYEDPWHDHAATSHVVAELLGELGDVAVRSTWRDALGDLDDAGLLVVNSGSGRVDPAFDGDDAAWAGFHERLAGWARGGGAILALHQAANTFADAPGFEEILGGRWIPGVSMHPPIGDAVFDVVPGHPVTDGLGTGGTAAGGTVAGRTAAGGPGADAAASSIAAFDERYCHLVVAETSRVLLTTRGPGPGSGAPDGTHVHPVAWANEAHGGRTVYSGLGHDPRSFGSGSHRAFLRAAAGWLLGQEQEPGRLR